MELNELVFLGACQIFDSRTQGNTDMVMGVDFATGQYIHGDVEKEAIKQAVDTAQKVWAEVVERKI